MDGLYYTLMILTGISAFFLVAQLLFCFLAKVIPIKLAPVFLIVQCAALAVYTYMGVFGTGFLSGERIIAGLILMGATAATAGVAIAWMVYGILQLRR